jgi:hypothetical protein
MGTFWKGCKWDHNTEKCIDDKCSTNKSESECVMVKKALFDYGACKWSNKKCVDGSVSDIKEFPCKIFSILFGFPGNWDGKKCMECKTATPSYVLA